MFALLASCMCAFEQCSEPAAGYEMEHNLQQQDRWDRSVSCKLIKNTRWMCINFQFHKHNAFHYWLVQPEHDSLHYLMLKFCWNRWQPPLLYLCVNMLSIFRWYERYKILWLNCGCSQVDPRLKYLNSFCLLEEALQDFAVWSNLEKCDISTHFSFRINYFL